MFKHHILEFARALPRLNSNKISENLQEEYMKKLSPLKSGKSGLRVDDIDFYIEMGRQQGIEVGIEQGRKERVFEIARKMLAEGVPAKTITEYTDLDEKTILSLKKSMDQNETNGEGGVSPDL
jgi:predicted transposase/invertase (TIGR01784 family)